MRVWRWIGLMLLVAGCSNYDAPPNAPKAGPTATVYVASGNIAAKVDEFRNVLGAPNGGTAGEQPTGRREITWDGAGADPFNNKNDFPADFFNTNVRAGAVYTTPGTGLRNDSTLFREVNATYSVEFHAFSPTKVFAPVGSNQLDQLFQVAGQPTPARVRGFGVVFSDVDMVDQTTVELFAQDGHSLGIYAVPVRSDADGLSFLGLTFDDPIIARARISLGTGALGAGVNDVSAGGTLDLVVLDNVIYGEPHRAP